MFDVASKYGPYLDRTNRKKNSRLFILLLNLEKYINGAAIEIRRLNRARRAIDRRMQDVFRGNTLRNIEKKDHSLTYLAIDTHSFFVFVDKIHKLLLAMAEELGDVDIRALVQALENIIDIKKVRNHLEHIDERCLGFLTLKDKKEGLRKHISDFGNFAGDNFSFDGQQYPSGMKTLHTLSTVYVDLIDILEKKYAKKDPLFVLRRQHEETQKEIMQILKKGDSFGVRRKRRVTNQK